MTTPTCTRREAGQLGTVAPSAKAARMCPRSLLAVLVVVAALTVTAGAGAIIGGEPTQTGVKAAVKITATFGGRSQTQQLPLQVRAAVPVVLQSGWQTVTAAAIPAGWSLRTITIPSASSKVKFETLVNNQFYLTFGLQKYGAVTREFDVEAVRRDVYARSIAQGMATSGTSLGGSRLVALGDGAWGVADEKGLVSGLARQTADGHVYAVASVLPSHAQDPDLDRSAVDVALRELAGSLDGFIGPDPALIDTSQNKAGLAALSAAWRASRGVTRFTITRTVLVDSAPYKTVLFHDQARRVHGDGLPVSSASARPRFRIYEVFRQGDWYGLEPDREAGGCYYPEARKFPTYMRAFRLFGGRDASVIQTGRGVDWANLYEWSDGLGSVPPALILDPGVVRKVWGVVVGPAYGLDFKPLRQISGKTRIEYSFTGQEYRLHVSVRVSRGRIEAIRTERLDQNGKIARRNGNAVVSGNSGPGQPATQSIRIAYSVDPALLATTPICRH